MCWLIWAQIEWIVGRKCVCWQGRTEKPSRFLARRVHVSLRNPLERDLCYFVTQLQNSIFFSQTILFYRSVCAVVVVVEKGTCSCHSRMRKNLNDFPAPSLVSSCDEKLFGKSISTTMDGYDDEENTITKSPKVLSCYRCCMRAACWYTLFFFVFSSWNRSIKHALQSLRWEWKSSCEILLHFFFLWHSTRFTFCCSSPQSQSQSHKSIKFSIVITSLSTFLFFFFSSQLNREFPLFVGEKVFHPLLALEQRAAFF